MMLLEFVRNMVTAEHSNVPWPDCPSHLLGDGERCDVDWHREAQEYSFTRCGLTLRALPGTWGDRNRFRVGLVTGSSFHRRVAHRLGDYCIPLSALARASLVRAAN